MMNSQELNKKYNGKEVVYSDGQKARMGELTSYEIEILTDGIYKHLVYRTGTGPYDNVVARGYVKFVDETLQKEFIEDYEEYVNSEEGRFEAFEYYSFIYD